MRTLFVALLFCSLGAHAAGLGVSAQNNAGYIYLPLGTPGILVEPFLRYAQDKTSFDAPGTVISDIKGDVYDVGVGLFARDEVANDVRLYYGARIYYTKSEMKSGADTRKLDGYGIAPTVGAEYLLSERVGVAAEGGLNYKEVSQKDSSPFGTFKSESKTMTTSGAVILRVYF